MMVLLLLASALAAPHFGAMAGAGVIGGVAPNGQGYSSFSPVIAGSVDWRFGIVEAWVGLSGSGFVAPYHGDVVPAALLQGEFALGLGSPMLSGGVFLGAGLSGGEGGFYGRLMFPGPAWAPRLGAEARTFHLGATDSSGIVLLLRGEFGTEPTHRHEPTPPPPPPPVVHDDPYGA